MQCRFDPEFIIAFLTCAMSYVLDLQQRIFCIKQYYSTNNISIVCRNFESNYGRTVRWNTVKDLINKFEEITGSVLNKEKPGRPPSVNLNSMKEIVQEKLLEKPRNSGRRLSAELRVSPTTLRRIIKDLGFKIWRPRLVHQLLEDDFDRRLEFCEQFEPTFPNLNIIWTDIKA